MSHKPLRDDRAAATSMKNAQRVLVLSGAGISVSAGLPIYRSKTGIYGESEIFRASFFHDPSNHEMIIRTVFGLHQKARKCRPTKTHSYIARLRDEGRLIRYYTQNGDEIEKKVGLTDCSKVFRLHGSFHRLRCRACCYTCDWDALGPSLPSLEALTCKECPSRSKLRGEDGYLRKKPAGRLLPDLVLLDEPDERQSERISELIPYDLSTKPDLLLVLGTSLRVDGPANLAKDFAKSVHSNGGKVIYVNPQRPPSSFSIFVDHWVEKACDEWVSGLSSRSVPDDDGLVDIVPDREDRSSMDGPPSGLLSARLSASSRKSFVSDGDWEKGDACDSRTSSSDGPQSAVSTSVKDDLPQESSSPPYKTRKRRKLPGQRPAETAGVDPEHPIVVDDDSKSDFSSSKKARPMFHLWEDNLKTLQGMNWVDTAIMSAFLKIMREVVNPEFVRFVDQDGYDKCEGPIAASAVILYPICIEDHWVLARIRPLRNIDIFDSLPSTRRIERAQRKAESFYKREFDTGAELPFSDSTPVRQKNGSDCGVAVMMTILYLAIGMPIEPGMDFTCCRRMLLDIFRDPSLQEVNTDEGTVRIPEGLHSLAMKHTISVTDCGWAVDACISSAQEIASAVAKKRDEMKQTSLSPWAPFALELLQELIKRTASLQSPQTFEALERFGRAEEGLKREVDALQKLLRLETLVRSMKEQLRK